MACCVWRLGRSQRGGVDPDLLLRGGDGRQLGRACAAEVVEALQDGEAGVGVHRRPCRLLGKTREIRYTTVHDSVCFSCARYAGYASRDYRLCLTLTVATAATATTPMPKHSSATTVLLLVLTLARQPAAIVPTRRVASRRALLQRRDQRKRRNFGKWKVFLASANTFHPKRGTVYQMFHSGRTLSWRARTIR